MVWRGRASGDKPQAWYRRENWQIAIFAAVAALVTTVVTPLLVRDDAPVPSPAYPATIDPPEPRLRVRLTPLSDADVKRVAGIEERMQRYPGQDALNTPWFYESKTGNSLVAWICASGYVPAFHKDHLALGSIVRLNEESYEVIDRLDTQTALKSPAPRIIGVVAGLELQLDLPWHAGPRTIEPGLTTKESWYKLLPQPDAEVQLSNERWQRRLEKDGPLYVVTSILGADEAFIGWRPIPGLTTPLHQYPPFKKIGPLDYGYRLMRLELVQ